MSRTLLDKEVRRAQLVDASIKVFSQKGYRSASITDIIEAAGVARGTFYLYFDSKLDAFHAVMDRFFDLYKEVVLRELARPYNNPLFVRANIRESILEWLKFFNENKDLAKIAFRDANAIEPDYEKRCMEMLSSCFSHWKDSISRFQKLGFVRKNLDPAFLNIAFSGIMIQAVLQRIIPVAHPDMEGMADQWVEFIASGVKAAGWRG